MLAIDNRLSIANAPYLQWAGIFLIKLTRFCVDLLDFEEIIWLLDDIRNNVSEKKM